MKPEEFEVYVIPPNFMEGGTLFGGLLKTRNTIEAVILGLAVGVPVLRLPFSLTVRVVILCLTALPLVLLALIGVFGDTYWYLTAVEVVGFAGMMAGGVVMSTWGGFKSRGKTLSVGLLAFGSFAIGMGLSQNFILYLGLMVFYGVALTMVQTAITTMLQEKTDTSMQGRVFGLLGTMYSGFLPIGMAIFGPLADILPLQWIMIGSGIALIIISGVTYFNRELKAI